jgi:hypothetical protein
VYSPLSEIRKSLSGETDWLAHRPRLGSDDVRGILKNVLHNFTMSPAYPAQTVREGESRDNVYGNRRFKPLRGRDNLFLV